MRIIRTTETLRRGETACARGFLDSDVSSVALRLRVETLLGRVCIGLREGRHS